MKSSWRSPDGGSSVAPNTKIEPSEAVFRAWWSTASTPIRSFHTVSLRTRVNRLEERRHISGGGIMVTTMTLRIRFLSFVRPGRSGSVRMLSVAGHSAGDLDDHPKVALGVEVGDVNPAELTAEDHFVLTLCLRDGLVEIRGGDGNMVDALTFLGKETGIDALLLEWLDKLPHHLADRGDGAAVGALDRLTILAVVIRLTEVDLSEIPRT